MYNLNGIIVSESHIVKYKNSWIKVKEHPYSKKVSLYDDPYLYCLNTSTKKIILNEMIFTDWDEIYDETLEFILNYNSIEKTENISKKLDYGFNGNIVIKLMNEEKTMKKINVGDILATGDIIYGIVELNNNLGNNYENKENLYSLLVSSKYFYIGQNKYPDYNNNIDSVISHLIKKNII
jgi:hypothetical protein